MSDLITIVTRRKDFINRKVSMGTMAPRQIPVMLIEAFKQGLRPFLMSVKARLPHGRTGKLVNNTELEIERTKAGVSAKLTIGRDVPYAHVHAKFGMSPTIILPKNKKHLAIPLTARARNLQSQVGSLLQYSQLKGGWERKGNKSHILYWTSNSNQKGIPYFALAHQVKVKPSVDLYVVKEEMKIAANEIINRVFNGFDFGFVRMIGKAK